MITSPIPDANGNAFTAAEQPCFFCGTTLTDPAIAWSGFDAEIYLHPRCLVELTIRLYRDLHELEVTSHRYVTEGGK